MVSTGSPGVAKRRRGDGRRAGHAYGANGDNKREQDEEAVLDRREGDSQRVDRKDRHERGPHTGAAGHAKVRTKACGEAFATSSSTPRFCVSERMVTGSVPMLLWVVKAVTAAGAMP